MTRRPNIVYIMPDQWRSDALGFAGNQVIQTPHVDALAARGASFRSAYCESPVCQPARASLVTGRYVTDHGLKDNTHLKWAEGGSFPSPELGTFMQALRRAGYRTAEVGKMHFAGPRARPGEPRFDPEKLFAGRTIHLDDRRDATAAYGFDEVYEEGDKMALAFLDSGYTDSLGEKGLLESWRAEIKETIAISAGRRAGPRARPENLDPADTLDAYIRERACRFIHDYDRDEPFFLWVAFVGPHAPFDGPRPYSDRYDPDRVPLGPIGLDDLPRNAWADYVRWNVEHLDCEDLSEEEIRLIAQHYYGACTLIDDQIGAILWALEDAGIADDTWVLFGSDHGELLGDHGLISKRVFYRSSVLVPNVVTPPGGLASPVVVEGPTQGFDLTRTVLDLAGADGSFHSGRSLLPALEGEDVTREAVFSEIADFLMVATDRYKLVLERGTLEPQTLFDLERDPDERVDLLRDPAYASVVDELVERHGRPFVAGRR